jgi:hypothetical protein
LQRAGVLTFCVACALPQARWLATHARAADLGAAARARGGAADALRVAFDALDALLTTMARCVDASGRANESECLALFPRPLLGR